MYAREVGWNLPYPPWRTPHRAASTPLPAPRLDDHASSEPRCVLSPHTLRQTTPLGEDTLNFPQKVARQFDGNVVFSRYLTTIFAAFVRGRHNAAILVDSLRQSSECRHPHMRPIARIACARRRRVREANSRRPAQCRALARWPRCGDLSTTVRAYFSAHREVMPKARHANSVSF